MNFGTIIETWLPDVRVFTRKSCNYRQVKDPDGVTCEGTFTGDCLSFRQKMFMSKQENIGECEKKFATISHCDQLFFGLFEATRYFSGALASPLARSGGGVRRSFVMERGLNHI